MIYKTEISSELGAITAASDGRALLGLWLAGQKYFPDCSDWMEKPDLDVFAKLSEWLDGYFKGSQAAHAFALAPKGTEFQKQVWSILEAIPYGEVCTYGDIAARISASRGYKTSARAVGTAVGRNPISIVIPCHRVIGADKSLTGYAGGLERKKRLLQIEKIDL